MELVKGRIIKNRYEIVEELGKGGFGYTYKAMDHLVNRFVAIKVSEKDMSQEIQTLELLKNVPHISHIYDHFDEDDLHYLVMRLVRGQSLLSCQKENNGTLSIAFLKQLLPSTIVTLGQMHALGILHRDISPGNYMVTEDNKLYLIDFGTATNYKDSQMKNPFVFQHGGLDSPEYMDSSAQGPWTDVYMLCATIVNLLTNEGIPLPEERRKTDAVPGMILKKSLSAKMQNALIKGLSIDPGMRYQSVQDFAKDFLASDQEKSILTDTFTAFYHAKTDNGSKNVNQDNFMLDSKLAYMCENCEIEGRIDCQKDSLHVVAVADGVSSGVDGEIAAKAAIQAVSHFREQHTYEDVELQNLLEEFLNQANEKIIALSKKIGKTASTLSILIWKNNKYCTANIGDSPIYLLRKGKLNCLSYSHTVANEKLEKGQPVSISNLHTLTYYLGKRNHAGSDMAYFQTGIIQKNDTFLLCTDGLSVTTTDLDKKKGMGKNISAGMTSLFKKVSKKGYRDNCTAIIIKF